MPPLTGWPARLGLLTVLGLLLVLAGLSRYSSASERLTNTLLRERFTVGRLAGQKVWERCAVVDSGSLIPRTSCGHSLLEDTHQSTRVDAAERDASSELQSDSSTTVLRAGALLSLRSGSATPPRLDLAVDWLERARLLAPNDPVVLNDLAVAYLELGERDQQLVPMLRALDMIEQAFAQDSIRPEVLFNRALIHERLYLIAGAHRAWKRYLAVERHPRWQAEAEAHARQVEQVPDTSSWDALLKSPPPRMDAHTRSDIAARVRRSPQAAREFGFRLLGQWGSAVDSEDRARAARHLALAREIGAAADALRADRSAALAVRAIDSLAGDTGRLRALARAHVGLAEGQRLFEERDYNAAVPVLDRSERSLRVAGSPAARWAAFYRGASEVNRVRYANGDRVLASLVFEARPDEAALAGKALWALGLSQLRRGNYNEGNRLYREAAPYIARAREAENEGALALLLAEGLILAGQRTDGEAEALRALRVLSPFRRSKFLNNHLAIVATYARINGLSHAALAVTEETVEVARALDNPEVLAQVLCARVRDRVAVGRHGAARADLEEAMRWTGQIGQDGGGRRIRAHVKLALGQLTRSRDPQAALPLLESAVAAYSSFGSDLYLPVALYEAALAARASGDLLRARAWLQQAITRLERQQASFHKVESRVTFYETVENVFDEMIAIEVDAGRPVPAFQVLERGRIHPWSAEGHHTLSATMGTAGIGLPEIGLSLPEDMLFVEYALLRDRVLIWTATRQGWRQYTMPISRDSVATLVTTLRGEASWPDAHPAAASAELFDLLIRPLSPELKGIRQLTIVPDRELFRLPFAALRDRAAGPYLVERYRIRTVPSASFFLAALSRARPASAGSTALVVGDPGLDSVSAITLSPLPGAAREAQEVAVLYPRHSLLRGPDAHRDTVLKLLPRHSIFHFAGHAVFNGEQPERSYLALAPGRAGGDGVLSAWEIGEMRLSNVKVVVLSACSSLSPRASRTGTMVGLAYSFLRAGAPATVSTLWDVDDGATTGLLVRFHRHLAAGTPAVEALHLAQVETLRSSRPESSAPEVWAAFIYTGP
jgi:CHAT domain-containing protein